MSEEDDDSFTSDELISSDSDDENFKFEQPETTGFMFSQPFQGSSDVIVDRKTFVSQLAVWQGVPKDKTVKVRFILGLKEKNRPPGKGRGELDVFHREWLKLHTFSKKIHWRRLFHNSYEGDYYHAPMPFSIDGISWRTVTHFMIGMLYSQHPDYALTYSLKSEKIKNGWWAKVDAALKEHRDNIRLNRFAPDDTFDKKVEAYLFRALLAKFTQYAEMRQALLLTDDAVFSYRGGLYPITDFNTLVQVRDYIRKNPTLIYLGDATAPKYDVAEIPIVVNPEELNYNYVDLQAATDNIEERKLISQSLVAGGVRAMMTYAKPAIETVIQRISPNSFIVTEPIINCELFVFLATGAYRINLDEQLAESKISFVKRHIYALERVGDNSNDRIMIAIQRTPCSQMSNYIHFQKDSIDLYLEPLLIGPNEWAYGIQIISRKKDPMALDLLRRLINGTFASPSTMAVAAVEADGIDE